MDEGVSDVAESQTVKGSVCQEEELRGSSNWTNGIIGSGSCAAAEF